ncbi:hypothetical protein L227DRAFT_655598 [Lentinus tigrinus ALCF2SS1-6]|uniref:Fungal-type protein kinase domain-containing protein n=1 Tax=Lentinus tigrinus ALCF2SS1-6 TaxID=1328759 RepID=A0A5C2S137_9APHY|nr:hypothetical protein L227DRAFT_655598 [Lentinus tigrinus ALCF2SS1-6]
MGSRFFEVPVEAVLSKVPGSLPTAEQRKLFKRADFSRAKYKKHVYSLVTTTIDSVFTAASAEKVCVRRTDGRKHGKRADALNVGIYLNTPAAVNTTDNNPTGKGVGEDADNSTGEDPEKNAHEYGDADGAPTSHISWHWVAIPIEVKHNRDHAAFHFSKAPLTTQSKHSSSSPNASKTSSEPKSFVPITLQNEQGYVQFIDRMLEVFDNQHRRFSYAIYVWDYMARICFFDRGGAVISEEFNWTMPDSPLHDFVWKVAHMSEAQLGYDPTVERVSDEDAAAFKRMADDSGVHEKIRSFVKQATPEGQPIYKVDIIPMGTPPDEGFPDDPFPPPSPADPSSAPASPPSQPPVAPTPRSFLIGKAYFSSHSLIGRSTRGYIAYDIDERRLCFLKDYWRPYVPKRTRPEHMIYERMARCGVEGIPTLICGGDVGGTRAQMTQIQDLLHHLGDAPPVPRSHYRMATVEIGLPLESFTNFKQLALVFADAVLAHYQAWDKAKVLHRDISIGNILIDPRTLTRALLIDWDLCRLECELESGPTEPDRIGTFQFRSALAACFPRKPYRLSDDLESFIHAFDFLVLKYHPIKGHGLRRLFEDTYESYSLVQGFKVGGNLKLEHFRSPYPPFQLRANDALQSIINDLHKGCYESYRDVDINEMDLLYGIDDVDSDADEADSDVKEKPLPAEQEPDATVDFDSMPARSVPTGSLWTIDDSADTTTSSSSDTSASEAEAPTAAASDVGVDPCKLSGFLSHHSNLYKVLASAKGKRLPTKPKNQLRARAHQDPVPVNYRPINHNHNIGTLSTPSTGNDLYPVLGHRRLGTPSSVRSSSSFAESSDNVELRPGDKRSWDDGDLNFGGSEDVGPPPSPPRAEKRMRLTDGVLTSPSVSDDDGCP